MNQNVKIFTVAALVSLQAVTVCDIATITCHDLHEQMQLAISKRADLYVINVLPKKICADCNIAGTINIPFHQLAKKVINWPKDRKIVVHCAGQQCPLGRHAYHQLRELGFVNVRLFEGGLRVWKSNNLPTKGACRAGYLKG